MGKEMKTKLALVIMLAFILGGCSTIDCMTRGTCYTAEGITRDVKNFCSNMLKADQWIRENLW